MDIEQVESNLGKLIGYTGEDISEYAVDYITEKLFGRSINSSISSEWKITDDLGTAIKFSTPFLHDQRFVFRPCYGLDRSGHIIRGGGGA